MKEIYSMLGMSKQNVSQKLLRVQHNSMIAETAVEMGMQIRKEHPVMGSRKMYWKSLHQLPIVQFPVNFKRTTYSIGKFYHPNLIEGLQINRINQVWQSDITYFEVNDRFYYLVFIIDVYSRRIIGWNADYSLWANANISALGQAIASRSESLDGLIHHSDRGSQYIDKGYSELLKSHKIRLSMCKYAWENAYCERVNGIIKNEYMKKWHIQGFNQLKQALTKAVYAYNHGRPHNNLPQRLTPVKFEERLEAGLIEAPIMKLYKHEVES
jgi:hypothetical protein